MPVAPYPRGKARCVTDTGTSPNIGDQNWPMRSVVRPFVRSTNAKRARSCGCSSPTGGAPLIAPKKSASSVAFGAHWPSTGPELKSSRMRVFRMSPSKRLWSTPGCATLAHSAFCPCPKSNKPRLLNIVALMKPLMVRVSPAPSLTDCCANAADGPPRNATSATAVNPAIRLLMRTLPPVELSDGAASALHRPHGEALNKTIDEEIVDDGERNADNQGGGHERPPVIDVAPDQRDRHAQAYGHLVDRAEEGQRIHELLHYQREAENDHRQDARNDQPWRDFYDHGEPAVPVDHRLLLDIPGNGAHESHDEPGAEGDRDGRVDEDQSPERVLQAQHGHDPRQRDEEQRRGDQVGKKNPHAEPLAPAAGEPGQTVAGRHGHGHGDDDDRHDHHQRIQDPAQELRLPEQQAHVLEGGGIVEDPGDVPRVECADVEVAVLLERGEQHPVEREPGEGHEARCRGIERHALHRAPTSARRASRSIATATTTRNGTRNTAIAAPWPKSAPSTPRWNARVGST